MKTGMPTLAMVSTGIRRDLLAPLRYFTRLEIIHFYQTAVYGDLVESDLDGSLKSYGNPLSLFLRLWRARADLIQGVEPFSIRLLPYTYAVLAVALLQSRPLVIVTHENRPLLEKHGPFFSRLLRLLLRPVFAYASLIMYLNEGARTNLLSVGPYDRKVRRMMYGNWGVDSSEFTPDRTGQEREPGPAGVILFVGRLHAEKGVYDLLDAFGRVKARRPQAKLVLVGDGPAKAEIERTVSERGWAADVVVAGTVKNRDLPPLFRVADVFVAPSVTTRKWEEQVGVTNLQAMACGVPVISTRSGAIPEYVPDGLAGILVPERDPASLAEAIIRVLSDAELGRRMGEAGRDYCASHYDAQTNVEQAESTLLLLLKA